MAEMEIFQLYRPLESLVMVPGVFFGLTAVGSPVFLHVGIKEGLNSTSFSQFVDRTRRARAGHFVTKVI